MQENIPTISTLHNLLDHDARKFTSAEILLQHRMPEWIGKAGSLALKGVMQRYLDFVGAHVTRLEEFFEDEMITSLSLSNHVMQAFIDETDEKLSLCSNSEVRDACLLACVQTINHYKVSTYGTAAAFAKSLDMEKAAEIFREAEVNEKHIDDRLSQLANYEINARAKATITLPR